MFCAVDMPKDETAKLEEDYARRETPVVSNNSAHRGTPDVPMMIPEINPDHAAVIDGAAPAARHQARLRRGQAQLLAPELRAGAPPAAGASAPKRVAVCTYQAISGAGKTFETWPEMVDNVIPFIKGEEEKSEQEPLKIWGTLGDGTIVPRAAPIITAQCIRVPVTDGHMAAVFVAFEKKPTREEILAAWQSCVPAGRSSSSCPARPSPFLTYFEDDARPQTRLDRDVGDGMGVTIGRLRPDPLFDWRFVCALAQHGARRGRRRGADRRAARRRTGGSPPASR